MQNNRFDILKYSSYIVLYADGSFVYSDSFDVDPSYKCDDKILCVWGFEKELSCFEVLDKIPYLVSSFKSRHVG